MENVISASGLTKYYDNLLAVDYISFEVRAGEIFGFLGPNGAGKTTTMRMLTGLSQPSAGTGSIFGHDIGKDLAQAKKNFGVIPETSNLDDECFKACFPLARQQGANQEDHCYEHDRGH